MLYFKSFSLSDNCKPVLSFIVLVGKQMKHVENFPSHIHTVQIHVFTYINVTNVPRQWLLLSLTETGYLFVAHVMKK